MASSMGRVIPIAKSAGVSIEQLGASYAILTSKGIASSEATTYMASMFKELNQTGSDVDKALQQVAGGSFSELMAKGKTTGEVLQILSDYAEKSGLKLSDLFGSSEAGSAALTLLSDGAKGFNDQLKNMEESSGLCAKAADEMGKTGDSFEEFQARISNLKSDLGEALLPAINSILDAISPVVDAIRNWAAEHPKIAQTIMVVVAAIGAFLVIGGALTAFIGTLVIAFGAISSAGGILAVVIGALTSPITIVIGIIAGLIAIGVALYQNWDTICAKATQLKDWVVNKWNELCATLAPIVELIKALVISKWNEMKARITFILNIIKGVVIVAWNTIKTAISTVISTIKSVVVEKWNAIKNAISEVIDGIKNTVTNAFNTVKEKVTGVIDSIRSAWEDFVSVFTKPISAVVDFVTGGSSENGQRSAWGTRYVHGNDVPYRLHDGEAILPAREARQYRQGKNNSPQINITMNGTVIREEQDITKIASDLVRKINEQRIITNG